jgi:hypothetical protein
MPSDRSLQQAREWLLVEGCFPDDVKRLEDSLADLLDYVRKEGRIAGEAKLARVVEAAALHRNTIMHDAPDFVGDWVAVPREDFDRHVAALAAAKESVPLSDLCSAEGRAAYAALAAAK